MSTLGLNGYGRRIVPMVEVRKMDRRLMRVCLGILPTDEAVVKLPSP